MEKDLRDSNDEYASLLVMLRPLARSTALEARQALAALAVAPADADAVEAAAGPLLAVTGAGQAVVSKLVQEIREAGADAHKALEGARQIGRLFESVEHPTCVPADAPVRLLSPAAARVLFVSLKETQRLAAKTTALASAYLRAGAAAEPAAADLLKAGEVALRAAEAGSLDPAAHAAVVAWVERVAPPAAAPATHAAAAATLARGLWAWALQQLTALGAVVSLVEHLGADPAADA